jgi:hypothetical protein
MQWNEKRTSLISWGTEPTVIEPVSGVLTLRNIGRGAALKVEALDGAGQPVARIKCEKSGNGWDITAGDPPTPWYLITVAK